MTFEKGQSGNPDGGRGKKLFLDALNCFLSREMQGTAIPLPDKPTVAQALAHKLVTGGLRDDWKPGEALSYMQEICDRAYGKPKQALTGGDEGDKPLIPEKIIIEFVDKVTS